MVISRYLAKEVYTMLLATVVVLLLIFLSQQFVRYMHFAASGAISSHVVGLLLLLQLPPLLSMLLPLSLFLAILVAYGRLYADNEMTVMIACGVSSKRILFTTLIFSLIAVAIVAGLSLWINPRVYNYSDRILSANNSSPLDLILPNSFNLIANGKWVFYVGETSRNKKILSNIFAAEQPDTAALISGNATLGVVAAKNAYQYVDKKSGDIFLVLTNGYRYNGKPGQNDYQIIKYDEYGVRVQQKSDNWRPNASALSTAKLWKKHDDKSAAAELQWRISMPLSVIVLVFLGTILSRVKPRHGRYAQLMPAIMCYIVYANFLFLARAWINKGILSPIIGMWWVHILMLLFIGFVFMRREKA